MYSRKVHAKPRPYRMLGCLDSLHGQQNMIPFDATDILYGGLRDTSNFD